jgi:phosphatidylethanolamine-binding protein (PEBP) family uncharacterized protein
MQLSKDGMRPFEYSYLSLSADNSAPHKASSLPPAYTISPRAKSGHHDGPFVIAMVDPDVPTPQNPNVSQIRHFLGGNFFLGELGEGSLVNKTPAVTEYTGPHPADASDPHRQVFTVTIFLLTLTFDFQIRIFVIQTT